MQISYPNDEKWKGPLYGIACLSLAVVCFATYSRTAQQIAWIPSQSLKTQAGPVIPLSNFRSTRGPPLSLMTSEERDMDQQRVLDSIEKVLETQPQLPQSTAAFEAEDRPTFVRRLVLGAVSLLTAVGISVSVGVKGTGKGRVPDEPPGAPSEEPPEFLAALNVLWFGLVGMLGTLLVGLGREVYLGPLRPFILHDALVSLFAVVSGVVWVRMFRTLASEGIIGRKLSRKLIHISSAPLFLLCWPLYSSAPTARCVAALPPLANSIRLLSAGLGKEENQDAVQAISRQGGRKELLQGPLYYVLVLLATTAIGWRTSLASYVSISLMAGGDGIADIIGRRYGSVKLPWNSNKSWAGSLAMFFGGFLLSMGFVMLFGAAGYLPPIHENLFPLRLAAVCLITTVVESLPNCWWWPFDDNFSVPTVAMLLSGLLLHTF